MKKSVAILLILVVLVCSIASAFALTCETCGKTFSKYCNNKHHHYTKYIQCTRQTNCDFRGNYYSNYYKDSKGHELIADSHQHGIQHSYCGNSFTCCGLASK